MQNPPEKISEKQIEEALLRSGYLLESRLETAFRNAGYYAEANIAYLDPDTGKSRELDLYAMTSLKVGPEEFDRIFGVFLIECVNNPQPIAFITKKPEMAFFHRYSVKMAGLPVKIPRKGKPWQPLSEYLDMEKYHHYCKGRIATQFCSFIWKRQKKEWLAKHAENHFDSFRKLSSAVEQFADRHFRSWVPGGHEWVNIEFYYPLVVVQGELLDARPGKKSVRLSKANHIQYRMSGYVGTKAREYQIDVVNERFLPEYLQIVDKELIETVRLLHRRSTTIHNATDRIVQNAKRLRSPEKIRAAFEYCDHPAFW